MLSLPELQAAFLRAVVGDDPVDAAAPNDALSAEIAAREPLTPRERVQIYARMYGARLVDALAQDFPRVAAVLGQERFHDVAHAYVSACPSRHPSLRWFGARFPEFLTTSAVGPEFLADLARLEWARVMVFDAPDAGLLSVDALRRVPPDAWGRVRLQVVQALEVLRVQWPVHAIWDGPAAAPPAGKAREIWLRVWRQGDGVYQAPIDVAERIALGHVRAGDDFGTLCNGLAAVMAPGEAAAVAGALVLRWIADALLRDDARP
jgi:hypothetical protein